MRKRFIIFFLAVALGLLSLAHYAVYESVLLLLPVASSGPAPIILRAIFIILWLSFVLASLLTARWDNRWTRALYRISATWLGFLVYFFLASVIYSCTLFLPPTVSFVVGRTLFVLAALTGIYGIFHANHTQVTRVRISLADLPAAWKGRRIIFMSDLHLGQVRGAKFAEKIAGMAQALSPDLVLIGGDLYDGVACDESAIIRPLEKLVSSSRFGVYFITGNHEEFRDDSGYLGAIRSAGIRVLADECVTLEGLQIIGVDYQTTQKKADFEKILKGIVSGTESALPSILIKHEPSDLSIAADAGVALQLSGHTHRAQLWPFTFLTHWIYRGHDYGLGVYRHESHVHTAGNPDHLKPDGLQRRAMQVLTSSGAGTWGPPLRVGTRSEIVLVEL